MTTTAAQTNGTNGAHHETKPDYDVIIIGAGFGGLRMIHEVRKLGLTYKVIEAGSSVGGTWYWNRYPGARTDSESWVYILNFSKEIRDNWRWKERFPRQPEVLEYLNYVADECDMRKDIQFNTRIKSCHYDEANRMWKISTQEGESWTGRYFVSASGVLSLGRNLPFEGVDKFKGEWYKSFEWPKHEVDFKGKRVGIIGTGATAVQIIPQIAHSAKSVTVLQRTPNFVLPSRNFPVTDDHWDSIIDNYDDIWEQGRTQIFGMPFVDSKETIEGKDEAQIKRILDYGWEVGGFRYIFETFADLMVSQKANDMAAEYARDKIRAIVKDEATAELLCPDHALMAKRPPLGHFYYETFNKPHVKLVDIKSNPIKEITEKGVRTGTEEYEFDLIIYAIGFDAATGAYTQMDIRGRDNRCLGDEWNKSLETFLGITVEGYPNMFMISAPQSPFANLPVVLDNTANWVGSTMKYMEDNKYTEMDPTKEATEKWCELLNQGFEATILKEAAKKAGSWYIGANVPGKAIRPLFWFGGIVSYFQICNAEVDNNFPGITMT